MIWLVAGLIGVIVVALYTAAVNREFLRCPHCRKIGSWRFDNSGPAAAEFDADGELVGSVQPQVCRRCGEQVLQEWTDHTGRTIRKA
ncbi:MAG: hypothetical protein KJO54_10595 [Gammaproteobacteria bacterium]|nr:hypothetical protein [Gammaproteobacteria bacterium]